MKKSIELHPLCHLAFCLAFSSIAFIFGKPLILLLICLVAMLYAALRLERGGAQTLKTLLHSLPLVLSIAVLQLLFRSKGHTLWQFGFIKISEEGGKLAMQMGLRLLTVIYCAKGLAVLSFQDFQSCFAMLHLPEEFAFMLSYAVHLVPKFMGQVRAFVKGLHLRGIALNALPIKQRLQVYKLLAISALADIIKGSESSAIALELRGFRSAGKRSQLHSRPLRVGDFVAILLFSFYACFACLA